MGVSSPGVLHPKGEEGEKEGEDGKLFPDTPPGGIQQYRSPADCQPLVLCTGFPYLLMALMVINEKL